MRRGRCAVATYVFVLYCDVIGAQPKILILDFDFAVGEVDIAFLALLLGFETHARPQDEGEGATISCAAVPPSARRQAARTKNARHGDAAANFETKSISLRGPWTRGKKSLIGLNRK